MYTIDDLLPLSTLQHFVFCQRQCALIFTEQLWEENRYTVEGSIMHEKVHSESRDFRGNVRIECGVSLRSLRLGLIGNADVVEFHRQTSGSWIPYPVEYKRGKPKADNCDKVQLCAQALCLEEMLGKEVPAGSIFYGRTRRRLDVSFDQAIRVETERVAWQVHALIDSGRTPKAFYSKRCDGCSLIDLCRPKTMQKRRSVRQYITRMSGNP